MIHFQLKDNKVHPIKDNMYAYLYGGYILQTGDLDGNSQGKNDSNDEYNGHIINIGEIELHNKGVGNSNVKD